MGNSYAQPIDPSRTAALQPGQIWVPTPTGKVAMTLPEARQYQAAHPAAFDDPNNPNLAPWVRQGIQDPRVQAAVREGRTEDVQIGDTKFHVKNGKLDGYSKGGIWKPILLGAAVVGSAVAAPYLVPHLIGAGTAGGTAAATGATGAGTTAAGAGAAGSAGAAGAAGLLPATATVPLSTGTVAGLGASGAVPAAFAGGGGGSSLLGAAGHWLSSPGGATAISTAGGLIGAGIQSSGQTKAAEIQAQYLREALAYEKQRDQYLQNLEAQRYGELNQRLQPYISTGQNASERMAQILGLPPSTPYTPSTPIPTTPAIPPGYDQRGPGTPGSNPIGVAVPRGATTPNPVPSQLITMRAPDGTQKQVPANQVSHYQQLGAQVIG